MTYPVQTDFQSDQRKTLASTTMLPWEPAMFERFTDRARKVMALTNQAAQKYNCETIDTEHILLGLVNEGSGVGANVLKNLNIDFATIQKELARRIVANTELAALGKLPTPDRVKKTIEFAMEEARNLNHNYVGTEHLLLGLLRDREGVAAELLESLGVTLDAVREEILNLLGHTYEDNAKITTQPMTLETFDHMIEHCMSFADPIYRKIQSQKEHAVKDADYEKAANIRDLEQYWLRVKRQVIHRIMETDLSRRNREDDQYTSGEYTAGNFLLSLILADPDLSKHFKTMQARIQLLLEDDQSDHPD